MRKIALVFAALLSLAVCPITIASASHDVLLYEEIRSQKFSRFVRTSLRGAIIANPFTIRLQADLFKEIKGRYDNKLVIGPIYKYHTVRTYAQVHAGTSDGTPLVVFIFPALMDSLVSIRDFDSDNVKELFENDFLVEYLHELQHLAYGRVKRDMQPGEIVQEEMDTWVRTCEKVVRPLVESGAQVTENSVILCEVWEGIGRDKNDPIWKRAMEIVYLGNG